MAIGTWLYGYREFESGLELKSEWEPSVKVYIKDPRACPLRKPRARQIAPRVAGIIPFTPDSDDVRTILSGGSKRIWRRLLQRFRAGLRRFTYQLCRANWHYIPYEEDYPDIKERVEVWLAKTHYSEIRKNQIRKALQIYLETGRIPRFLKMFIKREFYASIKPPRFINARNDTYKFLLGPITKLMEELVYKNPVFVIDAHGNKTGA